MNPSNQIRDSGLISTPRLLKPGRRLSESGFETRDTGFALTEGPVAASARLSGDGKNQAPHGSGAKTESDDRWGILPVGSRGRVSPSPR